MLALLLPLPAIAAEAVPADMPENPIELPGIGSSLLTVLSPTILELTLITTKDPDPARPATWDFVGENFELKLPEKSAFRVLVNGAEAAISELGFKRRPIYAPLARRDLRIGNHLYLKLEAPLPEDAKVVVENPSEDLWKPATPFESTLRPHRLNPAIHVNQVGHAPPHAKRAMVGYYLGSLGEMEVPEKRFSILERSTGREVHSGELRPRPDQGYTYEAYQKVYEADFSSLQDPGEYVVAVPGLGVSLPFRVDEGAPAAFARALALGIYHQRCGGTNELPYTRFTHDACHVAPAEVPTMAFEQTQKFLAGTSSEYSKESRHTAPQLKDVESSLYPFANQGKVDVSGGHHDAGDYSKYTINSASFIHHLVFAADALPDVAKLDNLGLPESGNGKSDILELAKWEADFLVKLQDADGGFYFLVYPRDRKYESDVLPDKGDPQIVYPKTTASTAAAVGALAQTASSPEFKRLFPEAAEKYKGAAVRGWKFLQDAIAKHGRDGSYQRITHYGDTFIHDDELAWAAAEIYLLTGDKDAHADLLAHYDPENSETRRWSWWRLFEAYGNAARSYAFAVRSGRVPAERLDAGFLAKCEAEILKAGADVANAAQASAYGTSFPTESKRHRSAGWYFSGDRAFDATVAEQLEPRPEFNDASLSNLDFEGGRNPQNIPYITGLGLKRQRDIVHQYSQNDRRTLPPSGIPVGNVQEGFAYLEPYKRELGQLTYPFDGADVPYAPYDRWGDSFNVSAEFVNVNQARQLAVAAALMAKSGVRDQDWRAAGGRITDLPELARTTEEVSPRLEADGVDLKNARIVWEAREEEPVLADRPRFKFQHAGPHWIEAEATLPDGRRVFAASEVAVAPASGGAAAEAGPNTILLLGFDDAEDGAEALAPHLDGKHSTERSAEIQGSPGAGTGNLGWMQTPSGKSLQLQSFEDAIRVPVALGAIDPYSFSLSARLWFEKLPWGELTTPLFAITYRDEIVLGFRMDKWLQPAAPMLQTGQVVLVSHDELAALLQADQWHQVKMTIKDRKMTLEVDGKVAKEVDLPEEANLDRLSSDELVLHLGNFIGYADEIRLDSPAGE